MTTKQQSQNNMHDGRTMRKRMSAVMATAFVICSMLTHAQGTWSTVSNTAPAANNGVMLLLANGTIMCKSNAGGGDGVGNQWNLLTPDANGSYANGTWTTLAAMARTRLYFASQVMQDGRVFVAGGEYGTGGTYGETYDPQTNTWGTELTFSYNVSDANSEILPNGKVLVAPVNNAPNTFIYDGATNTTTAGPSNVGGTNESAWMKLPDGSILFVPTNGTVSERYFPATNTWATDATVPVGLYSPFGSETGAAFLLPNGKAFFLGGNSNTAIYTPTGNTTLGNWVQGANIPNSLSAPDAAAAMMVNGKILCAVSPTLTCCNAAGKPIFNTPISFYEYDYTTNAFTQVNAPAGGLTVNSATYITNMIDLPNGQVLYSQQGSNQYYVYTPSGSPIAAGKPTITDIAQHPDGSFTLTGTKLNGISEGASYGDDWQMNTNYPIVRLTSGSNVYYARTYNWSSTGVTDGTTSGTSTTTEFVLPAGLPNGNYSLVVTANGIASDPVTFCTPHIDAAPSVSSIILCNGQCNGAVTANPIGTTSPQYSWSNGGTTATIGGLCTGTYTVTVTNLSGSGCAAVRSVVLSQPAPLVVSPVATSNFHGYNVSCFGGSNGTASANPSGGTAPYSYSWSNGQNTNNATGLYATTYTVTITDANGCTVSGSVTLSQPPLLTTTATPTSNYNGYNVRCHGGSDGTATASPTGGVTPYAYNWSNSQTTKNAIGLMATTYNVTVTDLNACTATASTTLTEPPALTIDAGANKIVYRGYPDSSCATLTATGGGGGVPPYTLTWSTGSHTSSITVCPIASTIYYVTIKDANNCTLTDSVRVCVIDVRCGPGLKNVQLCHRTYSTPPYVTICTDVAGAKYHFQTHVGDQLAACGTPKICNFPAALRLDNSDEEAINGTSTYLNAFPNPFTAYTTVRFKLVGNAHAVVKIFDATGREMSTLFDEPAIADNIYDLTFNGTDYANGIYFVSVKTDAGESQVRKLVLTK